MSFGIREGPLAEIRSVIRGISVAGDSYYMPWLIAQMEDLNLARLAG